MHLHIVTVVPCAYKDGIWLSIAITWLYKQGHGYGTIGAGEAVKLFLMSGGKELIAVPCVKYLIHICKIRTEKKEYV